MHRAEIEAESKTIAKTVVILQHLLSRATLLTQKLTQNLMQDLKVESDNTRAQGRILTQSLNVEFDTRARKQ